MSIDGQGELSMVGWVVGHLVGCLAKLLVRCLIGRIVYWFVSHVTS